MKFLMSAALALSLLGGTAAVAAPYDHGGQGYNSGHSYQSTNYGYGNQDRGDYSRRHDDNNWQRRHHRHHSSYRRDGGRYDNGYGYDRGYGGHHSDYDDERPR